jgi:hypothetical protein
MTLYTAGPGSLDVEPADDPTSLNISVIDNSQVPTARLPFADVVKLYQELGDWIIATRPMVPYKVGDLWDDDRPPVQGLVLRAIHGRDVYIYDKGYWLCTGTEGRVNPDKRGARVLYVPEEEKS